MQTTYRFFTVLRILGCLSRIPDLIFSIPNPGSRVNKIPDPHQAFLTQKTDTKFSKIRSGTFIPDPGFWLWILIHLGSRIRIRNTEFSRPVVRITFHEKLTCTRKSLKPSRKIIKLL
jgi:hypothetical protein